MKKFILILLIIFIQHGARGQTRMSFASAYDTALRHNLQLSAADLQIERSRSFANTWLEIPKTGVFVENEDLQPGDKGILKIGVSQSLDWPGVYRARRRLYKEQVNVVMLSRGIKAMEIKRDLQIVYYELWYLQAKKALWERLDSIYGSLSKAANLRVKTGDAAGLDSIAAGVKSREIHVQLNMLNRDILSRQYNLKKFLNASQLYLPEEKPLEKILIVLKDTGLAEHPQIRLQEQAVKVAGAEVKLAGMGLKPSFEGRFFSQRLYGITPPYSGFSVTAAFPIFGRSSYNNKVAAARIEQNYQTKLLEYERLNLNTNYRQAALQLAKDQELLSFYETSGLAQADAIIRAANISYRAGETSFADLSQFLTQAIEIQKNYLDVLNSYNQSAIQVNYYLNKP